MTKPHRTRAISDRERIIVALDVDSPQIARAIIDEIGDLVGAFKIGLQLFTAAGPNFVRELVSAGQRVFLDLKFHDIPNTVARAAIESSRLGVWMLNVHALGGGGMMRRTMSEVNEVCFREKLARPKIIAVTILTSSDANSLREIGIERDVGDEVLKLAQLASECGLDGVVASSHETEGIRNAALSDEFIVVTPGIRPASSAINDQRRVSTPVRALASGSDYLVIGRPITEAVDKRAAAESIVKEIEAAKLS